MQEITHHPPGTISWADLTSTDQDGARKFYTQLFGWDTNDMPMGGGMYYTMFQLNGLDVAAVSPMQPGQQEQGMPSAWNTYITVDNLEATTERAGELGATVVVPPFDVFDSGRMSVIQDPTGAFISFWEPRNHIGARLMYIPGTLCWSELATRDAARAVEFYTSLLGWAAEHVPEMHYHVLRNGDRQVGGIVQMNEEWGDAPPHWMNYFAVEDCDATAARVQELGGQVSISPTDIPEIGRFAVFQDPQGAFFSVLQPESWDAAPNP